MTLYTKYAPRRSAPKKKVNDDDSLSTGTVILIMWVLKPLKYPVHDEDDAIKHLSVVLMCTLNLMRLSKASYYLPIRSKRPVYVIFSVFCLTALYIGIGVPYMKFARGARGKEIIPHYSFWSEVPSLAKVIIFVILNVMWLGLRIVIAEHFPHASTFFPLRSKSNAKCTLHTLVVLLLQPYQKLQS